MTSLAGAVQSVDSGEILESLQRDGSAGIARAQTWLERHVSFSPSEAVSVSTKTERVAKHVADTNDIPSASRMYVVAKRAVDIVGSLVGLIMISPLIAAIAILTKLSDGGPVFYRHTRVGKWGREFQCLKFRTMVVGADHRKAEIQHLNTHDDHRTFKVPDDPRVTRLGRWLRRASIDEMPQLWNVLRGEMSLVGPRPPVPLEVQKYDLDHMQRLMVQPGLTCIWQVSGRSRLPFPKQFELDMAYIRQRSFWLDMKLMLQTIPAVLSADGAY